MSERPAESVQILTVGADPAWHRQLKELIDAGRHVWIHAPGALEAGLDELAAILDLHPLIVEDLRELGQRPKVERYGDTLLVTAHSSTTDGAPLQGWQADLVEIAVVVGPAWVVTVCERPLWRISRLADEVAATANLSRELLVHRVLDSAIDGLLEAAEQVSRRVGDFELEILGGAVDDIGELRRMRRAVFELYSITVVQRAALAGLETELDEFPGFNHQLQHYYRDVVDHASRAHDEASLAREMVTHAFDGYLAMLANRQNDVVRRLTVVSTIFLPLMFLTGFFGMNFGWMVREIDGPIAFILLGVGSSIASAVAIVVWMRRNSLS